MQKQVQLNIQEKYYLSNDLIFCLLLAEAGIFKSLAEAVILFSNMLFVPLHVKSLKS
jgi:hypothetical protein